MVKSNAGMLEGNAKYILFGFEGALGSKKAT
jgi:hypothetical protein